MMKKLSAKLMGIIACLVCMYILKNYQVTPKSMYIYLDKYVAKSCEVDNNSKVWISVWATLLTISICFLIYNFEMAYWIRLVTAMGLVPTVICIAVPRSLYHMEEIANHFGVGPANVWFFFLLGTEIVLAALIIIFNHVIANSLFGIRYLHRKTRGKACLDEKNFIMSYPNEQSLDDFKEK